MPALDLFVGPPTPFTPPDGNLDLNPSLPGLNRVLIRQLSCSLRVPPISGAYTAILDTGAPLTIFPRCATNTNDFFVASSRHAAIAVTQPSGK